MGLLIALLLALEGLYTLLFPLGFDLQEILPWVGRTLWPQLHVLLPGAALAALACAALGVLCGTFAKSIDGFAVMMNFVIFPVFFFSGALYPIDPMPALARWVALVNPFSYCVDLLRHAFSSHAEFGLMFATLVLVGATVAMLIVATWKFSQSGAAVPLNQ